jgi:hypothetical protein
MTKLNAKNRTATACKGFAVLVSIASISTVSVLSGTLTVAPLQAETAPTEKARAATSTQNPTPRIVLHPVAATESVSQDADDPALWVHPTDASRSLIIGTNKTQAPDGALYVFGLDGKTLQVIKGLDRPNNVDVEYGLNLGGENVDIVVTTERLQKRLRVFRVSPADRKLIDIAPQGLPVFSGLSGGEALRWASLCTSVRAMERFTPLSGAKPALAKATCINIRCTMTARAKSARPKCASSVSSVGKVKLKPLPLMMHWTLSTTPMKAMESINGALIPTRPMPTWNWRISDVKATPATARVLQYIHDRTAPDTS